MYRMSGNSLEETVQRVALSVQGLTEQMIVFKEEMCTFKEGMLLFKDEMRAFKEEMLLFKDEMRVFKEEMLLFKEEMLLFKDEMSGFKDEMLFFKDEMSSFKNETHAIVLRIDRSLEEGKRERKEFKRAWGDLANKLGTILEDIAAPNIQRLAVAEFEFRRVDDVMIRATRVNRVTHRSRQEFDVICACPERVIYAEMKSTPGLESLQKMQVKLQDFFQYFPEYQGRQLIGIYCSWSFDEKMRNAISEAHLYGVAMGEETMVIVVRPA